MHCELRNHDTSAALALRFHDFAVGIMAARTADMMRKLGLAAIGAIAMGGSRQGMMRAAHVAARRRGFSFRDRHGGRLLKARPGHPVAQNRGGG